MSATRPLPLLARIALALLALSFPPAQSALPPTASPAAEWTPGTADPGAWVRLRVRFLTPAPPVGDPGRDGAADLSPRVRLVEVSPSGEPPVLHRSRRLVPGLLRAVGYDGAGAECWRILLKDPRPIRVEATPDSGRLSLREGHRDDAAADVVFPGDCPVHRMELFEALWTGTEYRPSLLGSVEVPRE